MLICDDISGVIKKYQNEAHDKTHRYISFDYCYNYFYLNRNDLLKDIQKSCLVLGFYLASWGMYRGSSFLLNKNVKYLEETINYINTLPPEVWDIDVDNYTETNIKTIIDIFKEVKKILIKENARHITLVTKILLGVFGFIPAFDRYFCLSFNEIFKDEKLKGKNSKDKKPKDEKDKLKKPLEAIKRFYDSNKTEIDKLSSEIFTYDFVSGEKTNIIYKKAKIIDMYGFEKGKEIDQILALNNKTPKPIEPQ